MAPGLDQRGGLPDLEEAFSVTICSSCISFMLGMYMSIYPGPTGVSQSLDHCCTRERSLYCLVSCCTE